MPTKREREYYQMGFSDGYALGHPEYQRPRTQLQTDPEFSHTLPSKPIYRTPIKKRKLSAWNKYVKANSKKPRFRYRNGKLNLKKMAVAFRKTPAGKKKRR